MKMKKETTALSKYAGLGAAIAAKLMLVSVLMLELS